MCRISDVDDTARINPVRATYVNLYKWPESDAEFVKSAATGGVTPLHSRVAESIHCRQMYLRSYTFSRKAETMPQRTVNFFTKIREKLVAEKEHGEFRWLRRQSRRKPQQRCCDGFVRLLFCPAAVDDVEDHGDDGV